MSLSDEIYTVQKYGLLLIVIKTHTIELISIVDSL